MALLLSPQSCNSARSLPFSLSAIRHQMQLWEKRTLLKTFSFFRYLIGLYDDFGYEEQMPARRNHWPPRRGWILWAGSGDASGCLPDRMQVDGLKLIEVSMPSSLSQSGAIGHR